MRQQFSLVALLAAFASPSLAVAYCRTTTCARTDPTAECTPGEFIDGCQMTGLPLFWGKSCVSFSVQKDGSPKSGITANQLESVLRTCFDHWQNAECTGGGTPNITIETFAQVDCAESRYNQAAGNQNVWFFRETEWPHLGGGDQTIALTLVSFSPKTGEIYDVDVELNSFRNKFKLETTGEGDDLISVVQHESGHFLGLAHSNVGTATMWANYSGNVEMRTLEPDDIAGICAVNPPVAKKDANCDAEPRHGFSTVCDNSSDDGCSGSCAVGRHASSHRRTGLLAAVALGLVLRRRRPKIPGTSAPAPDRRSRRVPAA